MFKKNKKHSSLHFFLNFYFKFSIFVDRKLLNRKCKNRLRYLINPYKRYYIIHTYSGLIKNVLSILFKLSIFLFETKLITFSRCLLIRINELV